MERIPIRGMAPRQLNGEHGRKPLPAPPALLAGGLAVAIIAAASAISFSPFEAAYLVGLTLPAAACVFAAARRPRVSVARWLFSAALVVLPMQQALELGAGRVVGVELTGSELVSAGFYVLALAALVVLIRSERLRRTPALDVLVCLLGLWTLWAWLVFGALDGVSAARQAELAPLIGRPLSSLLLCLLVFGVTLRNGWRVGSGWMLLGAGFLLLFAADGARLLGTAAGTPGALGSADALTVLAVTAIAVAAWLPTARTGSGSSQSVSVYFVAAASLMSVVILVLDHFERVPDAVAVLAGLTLLASAARGSVLYLRQARAERRARGAGLQAVQALAAAVDAKDRYTHDHSERVAGLAAAIAVKLGFEIDRVEALIDAGRLHDVGKIAVPDSVLLKSGPLTEFEFGQVKRHSAEGERIVRVVGRDELALWIRHHHERWDGLGYPDGLLGDEAPLESRILATADAFDAMTSDRSYRPRLGLDEALAQLAEGAGTQFDPLCASTLVALVRQGIVTVDGGGFSYNVTEAANGHLDGEGYQRLGQALASNGVIGPAPGDVVRLRMAIGSADERPGPEGGDAGAEVGEAESALAARR